MAGEIAKLLDTQSKGKLDPADYERTVSTLLASGGDAPVITKKPEGAWSHAVVDAKM
jgi:NitT/TauT family transport system substrate-binding protein